MSVHNGHRQRMKERFLKHGLESFCDHEILELLLYYCVPQYDTNELAHRLINHFGSLLQVINAPVEELEKVEGVGPGVATYLALLKATHRHLGIAQARENELMQTIDAYIAYLQKFFVGMDHEVVYLLCLDAKGMVIDCYLVSEGGISSVNVSTRKVVQIALSSKAATVVLAHNHPGGLALPSEFDYQTTKLLSQALYLTGVMLYDHVVLSDRDYLSMRISGVYNFDEIWQND